MTQQQIAIPGTHKEHYICRKCELPCECFETVYDGHQSRGPPRGCQRNPSIPGAYTSVE